METEQQASHNPDPRARTTVNACWNCRYKETLDEDINRHVCSKDNCIISLYQVCKDWENDA